MGIKIIGQGLRRSGTTILFDIFSNDDRFKMFYEPLSHAGKTSGGGSGITKKDYNEIIREIRKEALIRNNMDIEKIKYFNIGAPKNYALEAEKTELDSIIQEYLKILINYSDNTMLKFTRGTHVIGQIHDLSPDAYFLHIIKDPARFTASHIFKKNKKAYETTSADSFFQRTSGFNSWSQERIANHYIEIHNPEYANRPAYFKLLYLWKKFNDKIKSDGKKYYKNRYIKISNDRLCKFPKKVLVNDIYKNIGLPPSSEALAWAEQNVRPSKKIFAAEDARWVRAFNELKISTKYLRG